METKKKLSPEEFGRLGGNALVKKRGKKYMKKLSKLAIKARWPVKTK